MLCRPGYDLYPQSKSSHKISYTTFHFKAALEGRRFCKTIVRPSLSSRASVILHLPPRAARRDLKYGTKIPPQSVPPLTASLCLCLCLCLCLPRCGFRSQFIRPIITPPPQRGFFPARFLRSRSCRPSGCPAGRLRLKSLII